MAGKAVSECGASASGLKMRKSKLGAAEEGEDEGDKSDEEDEKQIVDQGSNEVPIECAVCLQTCVYPVQLPCKHIFCFLCVKGVTLQSKRCAMCRREIPPDYLYHPDLLSQVQESEISYEDGGQWFYEGRGGWWQYDQRTSVEIEAAMAREEERCELLIAGSLYIIDFEHMLQYRRNDPSRRRRIKRDQASGPKKGVAGLRLDVVEEPQEDEPSNAGNDTRDAEADDPEDPAVELAAALDGLSVELGGGGGQPSQVAEDQGPGSDQH